MRKTISPPSKAPARSKGITFVNTEYMLSEHQLLAMNCSLLHSQGSEQNSSSVILILLLRCPFFLARLTSLSKVFPMWWFCEDSSANGTGSWYHIPGLNISKQGQEPYWWHRFWISPTAASMDRLPGSHWPSGQERSRGNSLTKNPIGDSEAQPGLKNCILV